MIGIAAFLLLNRPCLELILRYSVRSFEINKKKLGRRKDFNARFGFFSVFFSRSPFARQRTARRNRSPHKLRVHKVIGGSRLNHEWHLLFSLPAPERQVAGIRLAYQAGFRYLCGPRKAKAKWHLYKGREKDIDDSVRAAGGPPHFFSQLFLYTFLLFYERFAYDPRSARSRQPSQTFDRRRDSPGRAQTGAQLFVFASVFHENIPK